MTRNLLHLGPSFTLPVDVMTSKLAILAQSGAGKTTAAADLVEEITKAKQQFVVLDPKGDWWGIRASADGKGPGLAVTVFGGMHGDLPLYPESGVLVANLLVKEGISAVVDVSDFETDAARHRFTTEFAKAFYKAKQRSKSPVLLVIEEADESCPQQLVEATEAQMVGAIKRIVKLGRFCGIGTLMVSQRAADVNKKILSQMQILVVMRTWHETDLKAIRAALKDQVPKDLFDEVMAALPGLETGEAFLVAPHLKLKQRVRFRLRETFDAGETPKVGQARREPKVLAPVQLDALREQMKAEIERAKEDDPKALKARILDLERQLKSRPTEVQEKTVFREVIPLELRRLLEGVMHLPAIDAHNALKRVDAASSGIAVDVGRRAPATRRQVAAALEHANRNGLHEIDIPEIDIPVVHTELRVKWEPDNGFLQQPHVQRAAERVAAGINAHLDGLGGPHKRILDAIAWFEAIGIREPRKEAVAFKAGYRPGGGAFLNPLGALRNEKGNQSWPPLVQYGNGTVSLTDEGRKRASPPEAIGTAEDLQREVLAALDGPMAKILGVLLEAYPKSLSKEVLAEKVGYAPGGGAFANPLGRLRTCGLIDYPAKGTVVALPFLFLEA